MQERPKLKLDTAGDEATITVQYVNEVPTKFGTKLVFVGTNGHETPLIPDTTGDKQLERCGLTRQTAVGATLRFSRAPNPSGKPYWNVDVAEPQGPPSKRLTYTEAAKPAVGKPYIPGLDGPEAPPDIPEDVGYGVDPHEHFPTHQAGTPVPQAPKVAPKASDKMAVARAYLDLFKWVKTQPEMAGVADEAVQAASATIWIAWKQSGLV